MEEKASSVDSTETANPKSTKPGFTKIQVEELIKAAGSAGYDMGFTRSFENKPEPAIKWNNNVPEIDHWKAEAGYAYLPAPEPLVDVEEKVRRLEKEIKDLTNKKNSLLYGMMGSRMGDGTEKTLKELQRRLFELDPNSPWAEW